MEDRNRKPDPPEPMPGPFPPQGFHKHSLGRFGERVLEFLGSGKRFGKSEIENDDLFVIVDSIELGDDLFREEIGIDFHLSKTPAPPDHVPYWGAFAPGHDVEIALAPSSGAIHDEPSYSFTFTSDISFGENVQEFMEFIKNEIGIEPDDLDGTKRRSKIRRKKRRTSSKNKSAPNQPSSARVARDE